MLQFITQQCSQCKIEKELLSANFYSDNRSLIGLRTRCKVCCNKNHKACREKYKNDSSKSVSREGIRLNGKKWRNNQTPQYLKVIAQRYNLKKNHNLSTKELEQILNNQNNRCSICSIIFLPYGSRGSTAPHIDHDHITKKVRGLLCVRCNMAIGQFFDKVENIRRAADYVENNGRI